MPQNIIGIHIRLTDNTLTREDSPVDLFIEKMKKEIQKDRLTCFYLATDEEWVKKKLREIFGEKMYYSEQKAQRDTEEGIINAFTELLILSKTRKILAGHSSFSELASCMSGTPFELVSTKIKY